MCKKPIPVFMRLSLNFLSIGRLSSSHKLFSEISNNFQMNEEEITLEAGADSLTVKNYVEGSHVDRKFMRSQLALK